jgi:hypothetical protein
MKFSIYHLYSMLQRPSFNTSFVGEHNPSPAGRLNEINFVLNAAIFSFFLETCNKLPSFSKRRRTPHPQTQHVTSRNVYLSEDTKFEVCLCCTLL